MLRILYDDFDQKVKNIHDEMDLHHSYKKKSVYIFSFILFIRILLKALIAKAPFLIDFRKSPRFSSIFF